MSMHRLTVVAAALGVLALAGGRPAAQGDLPMASPESVGMSRERLQRVDAFIEDYIDSNRIAGAVTLVARRGKVVHFDARGWRHKEENQPMQTDTIFTLMSMTKPIVSTALMMLWEEGRFQASWWSRPTRSPCGTSSPTRRGCR
jgi:CubicO group peptidase (beta-lactamase class C family)